MNKTPIKHTDVPYVWVRKAMAQAIREKRTLPQEKHRLCEILYGLKHGETEFSILGCISMHAYLSGAGFIIPNNRIKVI